MFGGRSFSGGLVLVVVLAAGSLVPTAWISVPAALLLVGWLPGRSVIRLLGGIDAAPGRGWMAVAASFVLMPVALNWVWLVSNDRLVVLAAVAVINVVLLVAGRRADEGARPAAMFSSSGARRLFWAMVLWVAACVWGQFLLPYAAGNVEITGSHDYIKHHAVMFSLERYPLPLHNMFYAAESDSGYYYYHYPYLMPAALRTLTGNAVAIPVAFGLTSAVLAAVFMAMVFLLARTVVGSVGGGLLAMACVSVVGGFDIIPVLVRAMTAGPMVVTLDSWCPVPWRVHNLLTQYLWCPQHISAVVALMLCGYWLRYAPDRRWWVIMAPLLGASIFGSSVYLAMTIFAAAVVYVVLAVRARLIDDRAAGGRMILAVGGIAVLGLVLMGSQAWHYYEMSGRYEGGLTIKWERFDYALLGRLVSPGPVANLLDLPWLLLVEFGLGGVACLLVARRLWSSLWADPGLRLLMIAGVLGIVAMFVVRSNVHRIDYGFRVAIMPAMVVAAVCAGGLLNGDLVRPVVRRWARAIVVAGVLLGLPVGLYGRRRLRADEWSNSGHRLRMKRRWLTFATRRR